MGKASRRKAHARRQGVLNQAKSLLGRMPQGGSVRVRDDLPEGEKISNALSRLLEEEVPEGASLDDHQKALSWIVVAWNISLLDAARQPTAVQSFAETVGPADSALRAEAVELIERLMARKLELYPDDRRTVLSWDLRFEGDQVRIVAAAAMPAS